HPLLSFVLVLNQPNGSGIRAKIKTVALLYCTTAVLTAPWYVFTWITGMSLNNLTYLASETVHHGRNTLERLVFALNLLQGALGRILTYLIIPLGLFYAAYQRAWRWILIAVILPWVFAWTMLFSY